MRQFIPKKHLLSRRPQIRPDAKAAPKKLENHPQQGPSIRFRKSFSLINFPTFLKKVAYFPHRNNFTPQPQPSPQSGRLTKGVNLKYTKKNVHGDERRLVSVKSDVTGLRVKTKAKII